MFSLYPLCADITYAHFFPLVITTDTWGQILNVPKKEGDKPSPAENHWIQWFSYGPPQYQEPSVRLTWFSSFKENFPHRLTL